MGSSEAMTTSSPMITITNLDFEHVVFVRFNDNRINEPANVSSTDSNVFESQLMIPLYILIFALSIIGNGVVLLTLQRNKRMRTVTNVYLLNLAVADLLLGVFCMPFTLVGQVLRNFIFGEVMCKLIPYFQAVSVSVAVWTLVAISLERYFAICRPLKSRRWQTRNHASKMIAFVWSASLSWSGPILAVSNLQVSKRGCKCRESWPSKSSEQMYNLFLDVILLLIPLLIMSIAYFMIMEKLWKSLQREMEHSSCHKLVCRKSSSSPSLHQQVLNSKTVFVYSENSDARIHNTSGSKSCYQCTFKGFTKVPEVKSLQTSERQIRSARRPKKICLMKESTYIRSAIRSNLMEKSIQAKRKVIRMLFVIVAEFFICWTPLHILNTWYLYYPKEVYELVGPTGVSLVHLLAYVSACTNPITYCFMNRKFRQTFFIAFKCRASCLSDTSMSMSNVDGKPKSTIRKKTGHISENSGNDSSLFVGRISSSGRTEPEAEDRV